jgi:hypothetical protein
MTPLELAEVHQHDKTGSLPIVSRALIVSAARVARLEEALRQIAAIENEMVGGDWDEIEQARRLARFALGYAAIDAALRETGGSE